MKNLITGAIFLTAVFLSSFSYAQNKVAQHLQDVSVTIKAGYSEGSGVIISRDVPIAKDSKTKVKVNFVWTCAHVVDGLRSARLVIDGNGRAKTIIEFKDAQIVKELVEKGRKVGELKMDAKVILYSHAEDGEDLALLMVRKVGFVNNNTDFYLDEKNTEIGEPLLHVGSLLGQAGANSMTSGIMSQVGRVLNLGTGDGTVFDQTTVTAFPGSSGGGVFLRDGRYVGMLVRGSGETFNLIVPVRRMSSWAEKRNIEWALDKLKPVPNLTDIVKIKPEDAASDQKNASPKPDPKTSDFPYLIRTTKPKTLINAKLP